MKRKAKNAWMFYIISNDRQHRFDLNKDFYELDWMEVHWLDMYADLLNIKSRYGKSRARTLWERIHDDLPF